MWIADHWKDYAVLDCGGGEKIERWGNQILQRPTRRLSGRATRTVRFGTSQTLSIIGQTQAAASGKSASCPSSGLSTTAI